MVNYGGYVYRFLLVSQFVLWYKPLPLRSRKKQTTTMKLIKESRSLSTFLHNFELNKVRMFPVPSELTLVALCYPIRHLYTLHPFHETTPLSVKTIVNYI